MLSDAIFEVPDGSEPPSAVAPQAPVANSTEAVIVCVCVCVRKEAFSCL